MTGEVPNDVPPLPALSMAKSPVTYAGGAATMADLLLVEQAGRGLVDVTVGSALDLFGGKGLCDKELVEWNGRGL